VTVDEILDLAEQRIREDGYDAPTVLAAALEYLAESWVDDTRPMCPCCGRRRVNAAGSLCTWCTERHQLEVHHKLVWWHRVGSQERTQQRRAERGDAGAT